MATVIDDVTGEEVEVVQVEAVAAVANVSTLHNRELPPNAAKMIEQAMVWAVNKCAEEGITDPNEIRERMLAAREIMKKSMRNKMDDLRSQELAAAKEK
jgi:hypothetical protein